MAEIRIEMTRVKETKNMIRFGTDDEGAAAGDVYIAKTAIAELGDPQSIVISIQAADA